jgi:hypothetical protein
MAADHERLDVIDRLLDASTPSTSSTAQTHDILSGVPAAAQSQWTDRGIRDAIALISEHHRGKRRTSVVSAFVAIHKLSCRAPSVVRRTAMGAMPHGLAGIWLTKRPDRGHRAGARRRRKPRVSQNAGSATCWSHVTASTDGTARVRHPAARAGF